MNALILPSSAFKDDTAVITNTAQITHIHHVLKAKVGDVLKIGELGGCLGVGRIAELGDSSCVLTEVHLNISPPPKLDVTVILALPRPKVLRRLMIDMTVFGVGHIILINSARTDKSYWSSPLLTKLDDFVMEGMQQGMDSIPPIITLAKRFKPFVQDELPNLICDKPAVVFHPYAHTALHEFIDCHKLPKIIAIGAEGGFVPYEIDLFASVGMEAITLGSRILRTESAVNAVLGRWL